MLTAAEIADLRQKVSTSHQRRTFTGGVVPVRIVGGPLDGIETKMSEVESRSAAILGWCVLTDRGPVQVMHDRIALGVWKFRGLEARYIRPATNPS